MKYKKILKDTIENYYQNLISFNSPNSFKILLYHGVSNVNSKGIENYAVKHINQDRFYEQVKFMKNNLNILSISQLLKLILKKKEIKKNSVLITFDDGKYEKAKAGDQPLIDDYNDNQYREDDNEFDDLEEEQEEE